jgi:hypothetical protein
MDNIKHADEILRDILLYVPVPELHIGRQRLNWGRSIERDVKAF